MPITGRRRGDALFIPEIVGGGIYEYEGRGAARSVRTLRIITPRLIRAAHRRGIPVVAWTINRPDNMRRLIDWGVDGIVTDHIDVLKEVMAEKGLA
jgi:glycerophosphoryl diester phosphodiesterase